MPLSFISAKIRHAICGWPLNLNQRIIKAGVVMQPNDRASWVNQMVALLTIYGTGESELADDHNRFSVSNLSVTIILDDVQFSVSVTALSASGLSFDTDIELPIATQCSICFNLENAVGLRLWRAEVSRVKALPDDRFEVGLILRPSSSGPGGS